jgi:hypothetical protein
LLLAMKLTKLSGCVVEPHSHLEKLLILMKELGPQLLNFRQSILIFPLLLDMDALGLLMT